VITFSEFIKLKKWGQMKFNNKCGTTGWYGRPTENGLPARVTKYVHFILNGRPVCGYKPHPTMQLQWCASGRILRYIDCPKCLKWKPKEARDE